MKLHLLIPDDIPEPQLVLHGRREVTVDECRDVLQFDGSQVRLRFGDRELVIRGDALLLCALSPSGVTVRGRIDCIDLEGDTECSD